MEKFVKIIIYLKKNIKVEIDDLLQNYLNNPITESIVMQGLEPFDLFDGFTHVYWPFRKVSNDDVAIYTGYYKNEIQDQIDVLKLYPNIIVKFGRYIPNQSPHYDKILGVELSKR